MAPDNADCERAVRGSAITRNISPTHKHRRGKTGRTRKKRRHWGFFSRWKTSESDEDDDMELYQWSKSRGLTARTLPPTSPQQTPAVLTSQTHRLRGCGDHVQTKSAADQRSSPVKQIKRSASVDAIASMQEAIFLTKLCSSIVDKKLFVYLSKNMTAIEKDKSKKALERGSIHPVPKKQQGRAENSANTPVDKNNKKEGAKTAELPKRSSSLPNIGKTGTKSVDDGKSVSSKEEEVSRIKKSGSSALSKGVSNSRADSASSIHSVANATSKKEWNGSVESDILKLYESASPPTNSSNLVYGWARPQVVVSRSPTQQSDLSQAVDQKIERADHTPSYVQMLAKMFKSRMQIRKEREERVEENLKREVVTLDQLGSESTSLKSGNFIHKASSQSSMESNPMSKAHLRYRHLADSSYNCERFFRTKAEIGQPDHLQIAQTIRIDSLDVGYTHARYTKALKCNQEERGSPSRNALTQTVTKEKELESHARNYDQSVENCLAITSEIHKVFDPNFPFVKTNNVQQKSKYQTVNPQPKSYSEAKSTSRSALALGKEASARHCVVPNVRMNFRDEINGAHAGTFSPSKYFSNVSHKDTFSVKSSSVRWSTSIGNLYCRPPDRTVAKVTVQRA